MDCTDHLGQVAKSYDRFRSAKTTVLAVALSKPPQVASFLKRSPLPYPLVCDPDRAAYRAFGIGRTSWLSFLRPSVMWGYAAMFFRGAMPRIPNKGEDVLQLGGDFLLDRAGRVVWEHRSRTVTDRPTVEALLAAVPATGYR